MSKTSKATTKEDVDALKYVIDCLVKQRDNLNDLIREYEGRLKGAEERSKHE